MITFRKFRNSDPPLLTEVWNESLLGRGAVRLRSSTAFDRFVLAKPYFDPEGLILAMEDGRCLGFAHAGLVLNQQPTHGVVSLLAVRPTFRKRGVGSGLLEQCETYLKKKDAQEIFAGYAGSKSPFYFGLYGGSDAPGFLTSDESAEPFFRKRGYKVHARTAVLHGEIGQVVRSVDPRFAYIRQRFNLRARTPKDVGNYATECVLGQVDPLEFFVDDKGTADIAARTFVWEMEGFTWRWGKPSLGVVGFQTLPNYRRQGLGKFLLLHMLRHFMDQYFELAELQVAESNQHGLKFLQTLGFNIVDMGQVFKKDQ